MMTRFERVMGPPVHLLDARRRKHLELLEGDPWVARIDRVLSVEWVHSSPYVRSVYLNGKLPELNPPEVLTDVDPLLEELRVVPWEALLGLCLFDECPWALSESLALPTTACTLVLLCEQEDVAVALALDEQMHVVEERTNDPFSMAAHRLRRELRRKLSRVLGRARMLLKLT